MIHNYGVRKEAMSGRIAAYHELSKSRKLQDSEIEIMFNDACEIISSYEANPLLLWESEKGKIANIYFIRGNILSGKY